MKKSGFYDDTELYSGAGGPGASIANISVSDQDDGPSGSSCGTMDSPAFSSSFDETECMRSQKPASSLPNCCELCGSGPSPCYCGMNAINTPQVDGFWSRYSQYPAYLKRIRKRAKRRIRRKQANELSQRE